MRSDLNAIKMRINDDPALLFEKISEIQYHNTDVKIEEEDLIAVVLSVAPIEYQGVLTVEQRRLKDQLKLSDLEEAMNQLWRQLSPDSTKPKQLSLSTVGKGGFQGNCHLCAK